MSLDPNAVPSEDRFLRTADLARLLHVSRQTILVWVRTGQLPEPLRLSPRVFVWREDELSSFLKKLARA